jgi:hypothetical protein
VNFSNSSKLKKNRTILIMINFFEAEAKTKLQHTVLQIVTENRPKLLKNRLFSLLTRSKEAFFLFFIRAIYLVFKN